MTGKIFNIQRYSTEDGPGIRTTVFLKGCPLRCIWCSNPESQDSEEEIAHRDSLCVGCGACKEVCPTGAVEARPPSEGLGVRIDRSKCTRCGECTRACVHGAMITYGSTMTVGEVFDEVMKDSLYYKTSGGGVTASGGEPLMQADFVAELFQRCRHMGIHTAVETSGYGTTDACLAVCREADLVLFDLKVLDPAEHERLTGRTNDVIVRNFEWLIESGLPVRVRVPLIPGENDGASDIEALAEYLSRMSNDIAVDVIPYHGYGENKYKMLDRNYELENMRVPSAKNVNKVVEVFTARGMVCVAQ